jgi:hypothetical protein
LVAKCGSTSFRNIRRKSNSDLTEVTSKILGIENVKSLDSPKPANVEWNIYGPDTMYGSTNNLLRGKKMSHPHPMRIEPD